MKHLSRHWLLFPLFISAAPNVFINEIAWMGTKTSANDEWIELRNNTNLPINLDGWILKAINGTPKIQLTRNVLVNGFYLLERSDDNTTPDITADQIYTGALNNKGERLELFDNAGNLIDAVDGSLGWPAGNNSTKQTMEKTDAGSWQTSQNPGGTPRAENSQGEISPKLSLTETETKALAAMSEQIIQKSSFPLLVPVLVAIFSGVIILVLKNKVKIG